MVKKTILFLSAVILVYGLQAQNDSLAAQTKPLADSLASEHGTASISITVGNNGQIESLISSHYTPYYHYSTESSASFQESKKEQHISDFKFNLIVDLTSAKFAFIRLKAGYNQRKYSFRATDHLVSYSIDAKQTISNFNIAFGRSYSMNRFTINTGLEFPIFFIGNYTTEEKQENFPPLSSTPDETRVVKTDAEGGIILGINSFLHCKFFLFKNLFATTEISFGFLNTSTGKNKTIKEEYNDSSGASSASTYNISNNLKKTYFSPPELSLGIGYKF